MTKYFQYLWYVLRHKWFVFWECVKFGRLWLGFIHDWGKFRPSEFIPYAVHFYGPDSHHKDGSHLPKGIRRGRDDVGYYKPYDTGDAAFDFAWLLHQKRNKHHWQWWLLPKDDGGVKLFDMPAKYREEMLADWKGAGRAQGFLDSKAWYLRSKDKMQLSDSTRKWIENALDITPFNSPSLLQSS